MLGKSKLEKARTHALRLLGLRPRSVWELQTRLRQKFDEETCRTVIQELQTKKLLDDEAFSKFWVENRVQFKPASKAFLSRELSAKGVDRRMVERALRTAFPAQGERAMAEECLATRSKRIDRKDPKNFGKLYGFLRRRGFSHELATEILEQDVPADDDG